MSRLLHRIPLLGILTIHLMAVLALSQPLAASPSDNALLTHLAPSAGTLSPAFSSDVFHYGMVLPAGSTSLSFIPTTARADAAVTVNGLPTTSGSLTSSIPLASGANEITIQTTAADGLTVRSYRVSVLVAPPTDDHFQPLTSLQAINGTSSAPSNFTVMGKWMFFTATSGPHGKELWKTDGTDEGTTLVRDIAPGMTSSEPSSLAVLGNTLFFFANDSVHGNELWKSDGTEEGTRLVKDITEGINSSNLWLPTVAGGSLFFHKIKSVHELWKTDGTEEGTVMIKVLDSGDVNHPQMTEMGGFLYFLAADSTGARLWKSDGTVAGTTPVQDAGSERMSYWPNYMKAVGDTLYFTSAAIGTGSELWKTDGTSAGTVMIKDINPGTASGIPYLLTEMGGTVYFQASDATSGTELWKTDGTEEGTVLVKDIRPGSASGLPYRLTPMGNTLFFVANNSTNGAELWKTDGTTAGTVMVKDINPGKNSGDPTSLTPHDGTLFFTALDSTNGYRIWKSDGTEAGTMVVNQETTIAYGAPSTLAPFAGKVYFSFSELFRINDTGTGITQVKEIYPGVGPASLSDTTVVGGSLYFHVASPTSRGLWKSDGTPGGTVFVKDLYPGKTLSKLRQLTSIGNTLYFIGNDPTTNEWWKSDGTAAGTMPLTDITALSYPGDDFTPVELGGSLYYTAYTGDTGNELWKTNGTAAGTSMVKDLSPGSSSSFPRFLARSGNVLYFLTEGISAQVWKTDGTTAGTLPVPHLSLRAANNLTLVGNTFYFTSTANRQGVELWKSDGTEAGTVMVRHIDKRPYSNSLFLLKAVGNTLYLSCSDGTSGQELWKSDGTEAGTVLVKDINSGSASSSPSDLTAIGGTLWFTATDGIHGRELWKSDGTAAGTVMVSDLASGSGDSAPSYLRPIGTRLHFIATTADAGARLYVYDTATGPPTIHNLRAHSITTTTATLGAEVTATAGTTITARGILCAPASVNPDPRIGGTGVIHLAGGSGTGTFETQATGLLRGTTHAYRAYATTSTGTAYGTTATFTTLSDFTLAEFWRDTYFGSSGNSGTAADLADPDKDGIPNLLERAFRLHPLVQGGTALIPDNGTSGLPTITTTVGPEGPALTLQYIRLKAATDSGLAYKPQHTTNPANPWQDFSGIETVESIDANWERVTVQAPAPGPAARFGRVGVTSTP